MNIREILTNFENMVINKIVNCSPGKTAVDLHEI